MKRGAFFVGLALLLFPCLASAVNLPTVSLGVSEATTPAEVSTALQVLFILTILSVTPAILLMTTAFTRIIIVLGFVRQAMGTQNTPPNQVLLGLALFLTFFIMAPTFNEINTEALQPYMEESITQQEAFERSVEIMRDFMFSQVREEELQLFIEIAREEQPADKNEISSMILIPAFMLSELKLAFQMGFMIYVPFLVIDMLVASVLMSMGMMMLPPIIISLPFKLLLFVLVDGWQLVVGSLMKSFG
ncbi:flagellar type III secretion system pore protein FliP [Desulfobulbus alkaliphilus]|uniref:flagellar type III secretion system pore protein FliP n=1 Tax=Desulfobulbus alkaliphilus TaxID=869814 RepID=UPI0019646666|nr:flagellar type III secretion system pore protein FliP [Desulfobulbus alkaliphilus]MBM9537421.1 flagellar type III secretion system pore protein FliP [Desulfobulbus alkaliphilus]